MKQSVTSFMSKIPNDNVLRQFLGDCCQKMLPPQSDWSAKFAKKVLSGEKLLLDNQNVIMYQNIPKHDKLSVKAVYQKVMENNDVFQRVQKYLPDYPISKLPSRDFFFKVLNSVIPNFIDTMANSLKEQTQDK